MVSIFGIFFKYVISYYLFAEQEVDGETLISLGTCASVDQLAACGLKTVKQQLALKRLVQSSSTTTHPMSTANNRVIKAERGGKARKLTREEIKALPPEERRVYLMM